MIESIQDQSFLSICYIPDTVVDTGEIMVSELHRRGTPAVTSMTQTLERALPKVMSNDGHGGE